MQQGGARTRPAEKPLRKLDIAEVDQEILRPPDSAPQHACADAGQKSRLDARPKKSSCADPGRLPWQKVSRDATLSGHFFTMMQGLSFLPRPAKKKLTIDAQGSEKKAILQPRPAAPGRQYRPGRACRKLSTCAWLYLAAAHGAQIQLCQLPLERRGSRSALAP